MRPLSFGVVVPSHRSQLRLGIRETHVRHGNHLKHQRIRLKAVAVVAVLTHLEGCLGDNELTQRLVGERPLRLVEGTVNLHHVAHTQPCHAVIGCDIVAHDRLGRVLTRIYELLILFQLKINNRIEITRPLVIYDCVE